MIKFYKDTVSGLWYLSDMIIPSGSAILVLNTPTNISIIVDSTKRTLTRNTVTGEYSDFSDSNGVAYVSLAALVAATDEFFSGNDTLVNAIANSGGTQIKTFSVELTRPANATAYAAGDVVGETGGVLKTFTDVSKIIGSGVKVIRARIQTNDTGVAGTKFNLHLYCDTPDTTGLTDNGAFSISYANATKRIGVVPVVMGTGNMATVGDNDYNIRSCNPAARNVYAILETVSGFTPSGNSTKFTLVLDCELSNQ